MWKSSLLWAVVALYIVALGIVQDRGDAMTPYVLFSLGASTFLLGADRIAKAIEKK